MGEDFIWRTHLKRQEYKTSISAHENLTFVKHMYVDVNVEVTIVRLRFVQQD
jgi:hypothetical protein